MRPLSSADRGAALRALSAMAQPPLVAPAEACATHSMLGDLHGLPMRMVFDLPAGAELVLWQTGAKGTSLTGQGRADAAGLLAFDTVFPGNGQVFFVLRDSIGETDGRAGFGKGIASAVLGYHDSYEDGEEPAQTAPTVIAHLRLTAPDGLLEARVSLTCLGVVLDQVA